MCGGICEASVLSCSRSIIGGASSLGLGMVAEAGGAALSKLAGRAGEDVEAEVASEGEVLYRKGVNQAKKVSQAADDETRLQRALMSKEDQAYTAAKKFNINLRGRKLVYAPDEFGVGQLGKTAKANPWVIKLGEEAFSDERTLGSTIAHELGHSRDYVNHGSATEEAGQRAERAFLRWYDGRR